MEPTFWAVVQYVLAHPTGDPHWTPYSQACAVCAVPYTHILHFEQLDAEEDLMLEELGLRSAFPPVALNREEKAVGEVGVTEAYMGMLREEDWVRLLALYSRDVAMFGYQEQVEELGEALRLRWREQGGQGGRGGAQVAGQMPIVP